MSSDGMGSVGHNSDVTPHHPSFRPSQVATGPVYILRALRTQLMAEMSNMPAKMTIAQFIYTAVRNNILGNYLNTTKQSVIRSIPRRKGNGGRKSKTYLIRRWLPIDWPERPKEGKYSVDQPYAIHSNAPLAQTPVYRR